jgi:[ribosomal protein S18]-alanine N-acetyltransferase
MSQQFQQFLVVRPMTGADIDSAIEIAVGQPHAPSYSRESYMSAIDNSAPQRRVALVAKNGQDGAILGFIIASFVAPESELETLVTSEKYQRQGIARRLIAALLEGLRKSGISQVYLEVRLSNSPAISLYQSIGFTQISTRRSYYSNPIEDALQLCLEIGDPNVPQSTFSSP